MKLLIGFLFFILSSTLGTAQEIELEQSSPGHLHTTYTHSVAVASGYSATPNVTWDAERYSVRRVRVRNTGSSPVTVQVRVRLGDATAAEGLILKSGAATEQVLAAGDSYNVVSENDAYRNMDFYFKATQTGTVKIDVSATR